VVGVLVLLPTVEAVAVALYILSTTSSPRHRGRRFRELGTAAPRGPTSAPVASGGGDVLHVVLVRLRFVLHLSSPL
jgi:hypothetical protein